MRLPALEKELDRISSNIETAIQNDPIRRTLFGVKHKSFKEAALADIIDVIPIAGEIAGASRTAIESSSKLRALQIIDEIGGAVPFIGDIFDVLSPTNIISYIKRKEDERKR